MMKQLKYLIILLKENLLKIKLYVEITSKHVKRLIP